MRFESIKDKVNVVLLLLYCLFLLLLSGFKSAQIGLPIISALEVSLAGDKLMHFYLALLLSFLAWPVALLISNKKYNTFIVLALVFGFLSVLLALDELHQLLVDSRHFELKDTLFGVSGLVLGLLIRLLLDKSLLLSK
ncbi:MAG: VanZ family protein [Bermanella sp.]